MLDVCLLGTSGMMPLPRRALTALMTRFNGSSLLIDCGEGTQVSIREKGFSMHAIDTICLTHVHGDHVSGLPGTFAFDGKCGADRAFDDNRTKRDEKSGGVTACCGARTSI